LYLDLDDICKTRWPYFYSSRALYTLKYTPPPRGKSANGLWGKNKKGQEKKRENVKEKGRKGK
jgi:hypothetical protein